MNSTTESYALDEEMDPSTPDEAWRDIRHLQKFEDVPMSTNAKPPDCTRLVCISDTHNRHREVLQWLPPGDVLIHAGDITMRGEVDVLQDFQECLSVIRNNFREILVIAGNHDRTLERGVYSAERVVQQSCIYLRDSTATIGPLEAYGSPWTPEFCGWAFMRDRGPPILQKWQQIPASTDILITHGPPLGRGDKVPHYGHVGCRDLMCEIQHRIQPRVNIFGHIHEGYGTSFDGTTLYVNATSVNIGYMPANLPIVVDVPHDRSEPARVVPPMPSSLGLQDLPSLCQTHGWSELQSALGGCDLEDLQSLLPEGFSLLGGQETFLDLAGRLRLRRRGQSELAQLLKVIHAGSFPAC